MTNRYDEDAMIVTHSTHPSGFGTFVLQLAGKLGAAPTFATVRDAVIPATDGRLAVTDREDSYGVGFVTRFDVYEDDDPATEEATNAQHNAFVDRIHDAVAELMPGVRVDLVDEDDRLIRAIEHQAAA